MTARTPSGPLPGLLYLPQVGLKRQDAFLCRTLAISRQGTEVFILLLCECGTVGVGEHTSGCTCGSPAPRGWGTECQRLPCPLLFSASLEFPPAYAPPLGSPSPLPFPPQLYPMNPSQHCQFPAPAGLPHPCSSQLPAPPKAQGLSFSEESTHPCPYETSPFPSVCGNLTLLPPMPSSYSRGGTGHVQWVGTKSWGGGGQ